MMGRSPVLTNSYAATNPATPAPITAVAIRALE